MVMVCYTVYDWTDSIDGAGSHRCGSLVVVRKHI